MGLKETLEEIWRNELWSSILAELVELSQKDEQTGDQKNIIFHLIAARDYARKAEL